VSPVVFIVPAIELLKQTQKEFEKYLKLDGQPVKVGIAGGGLCDLNLNGINVITYQTALNAHNKKYVERGNKIVDDESGDGQSKSTAQLQAEYDFTEQNFIKAKEKALKSLNSDSLNIK